MRLLRLSFISSSVFLSFSGYLQAAACVDLSGKWSGGGHFFENDQLVGQLDNEFEIEQAKELNEETNVYGYGCEKLKIGELTYVSGKHSYKTETTKGVTVSSSTGSWDQSGKVFTVNESVQATVNKPSLTELYFLSQDSTITYSLLDNGSLKVEEVGTAVRMKTKKDPAEQYTFKRVYSYYKENK